MQTTEALEQGRQAFALGRWPDAYQHFDEADGAGTLEPHDIEQLATAAYLTGRYGESATAWGRAHQDWQERGDLRRAVRCAFWLGLGLIQRGDMAQGGGWLARAGRLVEEHELDTVERGYLLVPAGLIALDEGDTDTALQQFGQVASLARRFGDPDLAALGLLGRGQALLRSDATAEGLGLFDEAMVSVTAGETSPTVSGLVYCAVIEECQKVFDVRRATEWTTSLDRWCEAQPGLVPYRGQCLVHRAQLLQLRGEWSSAAAEAQRACDRLSDPPHPAVGMAHYQVGELNRLRGEFAAAETAYRLAHAAGRDPQPGLALLRLAEGSVDSAAAAITTALQAAATSHARARLLPAVAEIMLAAGQSDDAAAAADELGALAGDDMTMLSAVAAHIRGLVLLSTGEAMAALRPLQQALSEWRRLRAPYEAARVRALMASASRRLHDHDRADLESEAARAAFADLGAAPALASLERSLADAAEQQPMGITQRELAVLRLVAAGHTNRKIAGELCISEKTVERHLGNMFTKMGVSNRAGATAYAYERGLL